MALITYAAKILGGLFTHGDANEIKAVVNLNRTESDAALALRLVKTDDVWGEIPSGTVNGINNVFTIANANPSKKALYVDGSRINAANFSISGITLTITDAGSIPNNSIQIDYIK